MAWLNVGCTLVEKAFCHNVYYWVPYVQHYTKSHVLFLLLTEFV